MSSYIKSGLITIILVFLFSPVSVTAMQVKPVSGTQALAVVLNQLSVAYKVNFLYEEINVNHQVVYHDRTGYKGKALGHLLDSLLNPLHLSWYKVDERNYSIFPKPVSKVAGINKGIIRVSHQDPSPKDKVEGRILDEHRQALAYTKVSLLQAADSALVLNVLSDPDGNFMFTAVKAGVYQIRISAIGKQPYTTKRFTVGGVLPVIIEPIAMQASSETLKEVKIKAARPMIEAKSDRFIFNVENSAMAAGNSLQLLRAAPFVRISADNSVSLQGKKTMVLIDGKPLPDVSLENILQTMPAGNIDKIELITQPSAKYDGAYGAVINIITKKNQLEGFTGNLRLDGSTGHYANGSMNLSGTYKRNKLTIYANGGINKGINFFGISSTRFQNPADPAYLMSNNWKRISHNNMYSFQSGIDYQLDSNQTIGLFADANNYKFKGPWATNNAFGRLNARPDSILITETGFDLGVKSSTYNFNYHLESDSGKNDLTIIATYTPWNRDMYQKFPSTLYNGLGELIKTPPVYQTRNKGAIDVYIAQADYIHQFKHAWKAEMGLKYQQTNSRTSVDYENERNGVMQQLPEFSSRNTLQESITGGYAIVSKGWTIDKLQIGVRLEDTRAKFAGHFQQQYTNLFPTFLYQHELNKDINVSASFKKTITRAAYNELVPYSVIINQYTIEQGNPSLVPAFDYIYTLSSNIHKINLSLSYTKNRGLIGLFPFKQDPDTKITHYTRQNLKNASDFSFYLFIPLQINKWWETINSGTPLGYNQAKGSVLGEQYGLSAFHSDFKTSHIFKFSERLKLQVDAYYWTDYVQDLSHNSGNKNVDASFLLSLWEGKGQLRLGGNELIFKRNDYLIERDYGSFRSAERVNTDSKRVYVGFTYKFGKSHVQKRDTNLGNEDALKRL